MADDRRGRHVSRSGALSALRGGRHRYPRDLSCRGVADSQAACLERSFTVAASGSACGDSRCGSPDSGLRRYCSLGSAAADSIELDMSSLGGVGSTRRRCPGLPTCRGRTGAAFKSVEADEASGRAAKAGEYDEQYLLHTAAIWAHAEPKADWLRAIPASSCGTVLEPKDVRPVHCQRTVGHGQRWRQL